MVGWVCLFSSAGPVFLRSKRWGNVVYPQWNPLISSWCWISWLFNRRHCPLPAGRGLTFRPLAGGPLTDGYPDPVMWKKMVNLSEFLHFLRGGGISQLTRLHKLALTAVSQPLISAFWELISVRGSFNVPTRESRVLFCRFLFLHGGQKPWE